jgi:hypothetical protein
MDVRGGVLVRVGCAMTGKSRGVGRKKVWAGIVVLKRERKARMRKKQPNPVQVYLFLGFPIHRCDQINAIIEIDDVMEWIT